MIHLQLGPLRRCLNRFRNKSSCNPRQAHLGVPVARAVDSAELWANSNQSDS